MDGARILSEWKTFTLGELFEFSNGVNADKSSYGEGVPFINVLDVIENAALTEVAIPGRVKLASSLVNRYQVQYGDVLLNRTSETQDEVGLASVYVGNSPVVFGGFVFRARPKNSNLDTGYSKFALRVDQVREQIVARGQGGIRANIGQRDLKTVRISLPPIDEQRTIAQALSGADELIATLAQMIAKKQAVKQSMMQQLLTGKTRLPGSSGNWEHRRVADMGDVLAGKALNVNGAGPLRPYLRTKNVLDGAIKLEDVLYMPMTDAEFEHFRIKPKDILLNEGQSLDLVGRCSMYSGEFGAPCAMQNQLVRFRAFAGTCPEFAAHLFRHCQRTGVFSAISTQTTSVAHLGSSRFGNLRLLWPVDRIEQAAIAEVLSDIDTELGIYEDRLDKARAIKHGMMQQLLTGRIRLPVEEEAA